MGLFDALRARFAPAGKTRADGGRTAGVREAKTTAERDGEFVVFLVGLRINTAWKVHRWLPIVLAAPRMVRELVADPDSGLLGSRTVVGPGLRHLGLVQYWESFDDLRAYARDGDRRHRPAWQEYYGDGTAEDGAVGIWHETYVVEPGTYETVYNNMPAFGLGETDGTRLVPATGERDAAAGRIGRTDGRDRPGSERDG